MEIELTDSLRLGLKVGIGVAEPVYAPMRFEVRSSRMRQRLERLMDCSRCCGSAKTRSSRLHRGGTIIRGRFLGRHRQY